MFCGELNYVFRSLDFISPTLVCMCVHNESPVATSPAKILLANVFFYCLSLLPLFRSKPRGPTCELSIMNYKTLSNNAEKECDSMSRTISGFYERR